MANGSVNVTGAPASDVATAATVAGQVSTGGPPGGGVGAVGPPQPAATTAATALHAVAAARVIARLEYRSIAVSWSPHDYLGLIIANAGRPVISSAAFSGHALMPAARFAVLLAAAYWTVAIAASVSLAEQWRAERGLRLTAYTSTNWQGRPVLEGIDATMSNELLGNSPFPQWQSYSIEWNGFLAVREGGPYTFRVSSDDGSTIEVDGATVVDNGGEHSQRRAGGLVTLAEGIHPIRVRYFQSGGRYTLNVLWSQDGTNFEAIPPSQLLPDAATYTAYRLRALRPIGVAVGLLLGFGAAFVGLRGRLWKACAAWTVRWPGHLVSRLERPGPAIAVVLVVGGAVRLAMLLTTPAILWPDSHVFYVTAKQILRGLWANHDAYRTLAYPYFLAAFLRWSEAPEVGALILVTQLELGLLTAVLFYVVGRRAFPPLVALGGALLFAVHGLQLFYEMSVLTETLFTLTLAVTLWLALRAYDAPTLGRAAALGLAAVSLVLVRPVAQWFIYVLLAVGVYATRPGRQRVVAAAVMVVCYAVPLVCWMAVNQREYGFFGVSLGRGMGLYTRVFEIDQMVPPMLSAHPEMRELWSMAKTLRWSPNRVRDELNYGRHFTGAQADDVMFAFTLETLTAHPVAYAWGTVTQWVVQIAEPLSGVRTCPSPTGRILCSGRSDGELPPFASTTSSEWPRLRRAVVQYVTDALVPMKAVAATALLGLIAWMRWPKRNAAGALLALCAIYFTLVPALSQWAQDRFRLPVDAILFMFAAWGVREVARWWMAGASESRGPAPLP